MNTRPFFPSTLFALLVGVIAWAAAATPAAAVVIVSYLDNNFTTGGTTLPPSVFDSSVTASNMTIVWSAGTPGSQYGFSAATDTAFVRGDFVTGAFNSANYFSFTITPVPGNQLDLTTLTLRLGATNTNTNPADLYTLNAFARSSLNGYATNIPTSGSNTAVVGQTTSTNPSFPTTVSLDLSALAYQDLTSAVTFRLYLTGSLASGNAASVGARIDDLMLNGALIPEPGTGVLLLAGGVGPLTLRRRAQTGMRR